MSFKQSFKIATIRGVALKLHVSLLFILAYIVLVASAQFPLVVEQLGLERGQLALSPVLWGAIFAIGLFASVIVHEFAHVLVAQAQGATVEGITLWMLGGASEIKELPNEKRYGELRMAIIGPIVSLVLGAMLLWIASVAAEPNLVFISGWLGRINIVLGIFNLLPAFPLDGGRALRSIFAARSGKVRGTEKAVKVSKGLSIALGVLGVLGFNILLILIAAFIYMAAQGELSTLKSRENLKGVRARDVVIRTDVLDGNETIDDVGRRMSENRLSALPVKLGANTGIVSLQSLRKIPRSKWQEMPVAGIAEKSVRSIEVDEPVERFFEDIMRAPEQTLPATDHGSVIGVIRLTDLAELSEFRALEQEEPRRAA